MYKGFSKDEIIISAAVLTAIFVYRILEISKIHIISPKAVILMLMVMIAYLCFNRVIKLIFNLIKNGNDFYNAIAVVQDIRYLNVGRSGYNFYVVKYEDEKHITHTQEIHSSFSIKKWKIGDSVKIKVNSEDPDNIIIVFSVLMLSVILSIMGIVFESIAIIIYIGIR